MLLWYLFIDSNLYHMHHTHRSGSYDWRIWLLLPQPQMPSPMPPTPLPTQPLPAWYLACIQGDSSVALNKSLFVRIYPACSTLQTCRWGIKDATAPSRVRHTLAVLCSYVFLGTTFSHYRAHPWSGQAAGVCVCWKIQRFKWLWNAPRIIPEKLLCRS